MTNTKAEVEAAAQAVDFDLMIEGRWLHDPVEMIAAIIAAVEPLIRERLAQEVEALEPVGIEVIAKFWRDHHDCTWVSTGHDVVWSCGIIHPRPIHMQPTTRDRHLAALVSTQIEADRTRTARIVRGDAS